MQKRMRNAEWLNELLPKNAPLSTMRVITTSTHSLLALNCLDDGNNGQEGTKDAAESKDESLIKEYTPEFSFDEVNSVSAISLFIFLPKI